MFAAMTGRLYRDNIGDWFGTSISLLRIFESILVNTTDSFGILEIQLLVTYN